MERPYSANRSIRTVLAGCVMLLTAGCGDAADEPATVDASDPRPAWLVPLMDEDPTAEPQARSLMGEALYARLDTSGDIAAADSAVMASPDNVDLIIEAGRVRGNLWQFRQEMAFYSRAIELAPDDWRPYRFRGHRYLQVREFDSGIADFERARELAPLNWEASFGLGLAYFLAGRFDETADLYLRCLDLADDPAATASAAGAGFRSCSETRTAPELLVAMMEWGLRALHRAGRGDEAGELLATLGPDLPVTANVAYYHNLLLDRGEMQEEVLLDIRPNGPYRLEAVGFGVANRRLAQGDTAGAVELLEELVADPWWPGFGRIGAEVELVRMRPGDGER